MNDEWPTTCKRAGRDCVHQAARRQTRVVEGCARLPRAAARRVCGRDSGGAMSAESVRLRREPASRRLLNLGVQSTRSQPRSLRNRTFVQRPGSSSTRATAVRCRAVRGGA
jgi:hypothetical protein